MTQEHKIRTSFSRIKIDIDTLKNSTIHISQSLNQIKQNQEYLLNNQEKNDQYLYNEIKLLKEKMNFLEKQLEYEKKLRH